jgi:hypothetical protein
MPLRRSRVVFRQYPRSPWNFCTASLRDAELIRVPRAPLPRATGAARRSQSNASYSLLSPTGSSASNESLLWSTPTAALQGLGSPASFRIGMPALPILHCGGELLPFGKWRRQLLRKSCHMCGKLGMTFGDEDVGHGPPALIDCPSGLPQFPHSRLNSEIVLLELRCSRVGPVARVHGLTALVCPIDAVAFSRAAAASNRTFRRICCDALPHRCSANIWRQSRSVALRMLSRAPRSLTALMT